MITLILTSLRFFHHFRSDRIFLIVKKIFQDSGKYDKNLLLSTRDLLFQIVISN